MLSAGIATRYARGIALVGGAGLGTLVWLLLFLVGYFSPLETTFFLVTVWLALSFLGTFTGALFVLLLVGREETVPATRAPRVPFWALRVFLAAVGLAISILGVTISLLCGPNDCSIHPFRGSGAMLVGFGMAFFLSGMVLLASVPRRPSSVNSPPGSSPPRP